MDNPVKESFAVPLECRQDNITYSPYPNKDGFMLNCLVEMVNNLPSVTKRPGLGIPFTGATSTGAPNGLFTVSGYLSGTTAPATTTLIVADNTVTEIHTGNTYTGMVASGICSFAASNTTDATPVIAWHCNSHLYKYTLFGNVSTATQVPDASLPWKVNSRVLARGMVYLQGTFYVMDTNGTVYGSNIGDITTWSILNQVNTNIATDSGVYLARYFNYVVAFGTNSISFFYNAGNATASTLSPASNTFLDIGCMSADAIGFVADTIVFVSKDRAGNPFVGKLNNLSYDMISTSTVSRMLRIPNTLVTGCAFAVNGHELYAVTANLGATGQRVTMVYDFNSNLWGVWSVTNNIFNSSTASLSLGADGYTVTCTHTSTALIVDQTFVYVQDSNTAYSGFWPISYVSPTQFTYQLLLPNPGAPSSGATSIASYNESYFPAYNAVGQSMFSNSASTIMQWSNGQAVTFDVGVGNVSTYDSITNTPIICKIRTPNKNYGQSGTKFVSNLTIFSDNVPSNLYYRHTNDDFNTYNQYRPVSLAKTRSKYFRLGAFDARAMEFVHCDFTTLRVFTYELNIDLGK